MTSRRLYLSFPPLHLIVFFYWSIHLSLGGEVNVTVDDTDPSIVYQPAESWHASSTVCAVCLNPDVKNAYRETYHDGTHVLSLVDVEEAEHSGGGGESDNKGKGKGGSTPRHLARSLPHRRDGGDPVFIDTNVAVEFQFTGTAVYLYSIQPLGLPLVNTTPTATNLTFNLDNNTHDTFLHTGSDAATGYVPGVNVFSKSGLTETPHFLRVELGPNSVFLFDYMIYTRSSTPLAQDLPNASQTMSPSTKRHNIATFAGAVGGSVGVLALVSLGLAFSIIKRRRNYERRERLNQRDSLHTDASDDSPPEAGPAPFVPRFFPGTHVPADPPPYVESVSASSASDTVQMVSSSVIPASYNAHLARSVDRSYADIPPSSPPPPLDDILPPPPPFVLAINPRPPAELMDVTQSHEPVVATVSPMESSTPRRSQDSPS